MELSKVEQKSLDDAAEAGCFVSRRGDQLRVSVQIELTGRVGHFYHLIDRLNELPKAEVCHERLVDYYQVATMVEALRALVPPDERPEFIPKKHR